MVISWKDSFTAANTLPILSYTIYVFDHNGLKLSNILGAGNVKYCDGTES